MGSKGLDQVGKQMEESMVKAGEGTGLPVRCGQGSAAGYWLGPGPYEAHREEYPVGMESGWGRL